ncbi:MAG: phosphoribosyl-AMP cyclohydrolase [Labrys sp. (in: a-proteobacteria)]
MTSTSYPGTLDRATLEEGTIFAPRFDKDGLVTAIVVEDATGAILMVAHMNAESLALSLETGEAIYWSRSRRTLWRKGETSGQIQKLVRMLVDCDQDALVLRVTVGGDGGCCHTGRHSCFYREVPLGQGAMPALVPITDQLPPDANTSTS